MRDGGTVASPVGTAPMDDPPIKGAFVVAEVNRERLQKLTSALADGSLALPEIRTYPLEELGDAFRESEAGHVRGKLVITP
jgi:NADPH:quinone reductase-like Zn-dependent oxidoreductase